MANPSSDDLSKALGELIAGRDLNSVTLNGIRLELENKLGLLAGALDARRDEVRGIASALLAAHSGRAAAAASHEEGLGDEASSSTKRQVYLVTFPRPISMHTADGKFLRPPGDFTREDICMAVQEAVAASQVDAANPVTVVCMSVFRECHSDGAVHFHVALKGSKQFYFSRVKAHLLDQKCLASHWSLTHTGYASMIAYCYIPSEKKPLVQLDPEPFLWAADGEHPSLAEASREPVNAKALAAARESARRARAEASKSEQRFQDIDIWPIVVEQNIPVSDAARDQLMAYAKRSGGAQMVKYCFTNWAKLPDLVERAWAAETVEVQVEEHLKSRVDKVLEGAATPCTCGGRWTQAAEALALNQTELCFAQEHFGTPGFAQNHP